MEAATNNNFWLNKPLKHLQDSFKNQTVIPALVYKVDDQIAYLNLGHGFKGRCTAEEFDEHSFKSLGGFVGHQIDVIITSMEPGHDYIACSRKLAMEQKKAEVLADIKVGQIYYGKVAGMNKEKGTIFVDIGGVDGFCYAVDWDIEPLENQLDLITLGEPVEVAVHSIIKPEDGSSDIPIIRLSRKATMKDPWEDFIHNYKIGDFIPGYIVSVSKQYGIYVKVKKGVTIRADVPNHFGKVLSGEYVVGRLTSINPEKRQGKMVISNFPHGRKKNENFASYLFE